MSAFAQRALIGGLPPDPRLRGTPSCFLDDNLPASKIRSDCPSCPGPQGPIWSIIKKGLRCTDTAYSGRARAAGRLSRADTIRPYERVRWGKCGRMGTSAPTEKPLDFACRGRCPHRPADHGPGPSLAVGAAISRPSNHHRTKQVGRHQAVCVRIREPSNSDGKRPQWAENRRAHAQNLGRRNIPEVRRDTPP